MGILDIFRPRAFLIGYVTVRGLPPHLELVVTALLRRVGKRTDPPPPPPPPGRHEYEEVRVKDDNEAEIWPLRFVVRKPVGFYYVGLSVIAVRKHNEELHAQVERFFPMTTPCQIEAGSESLVELVVDWPDIPLEELDYYGKIYPSTPHGRADEHYDRGVVLYDKEDLDGAIAEFRTAIRLNPNHADAHSNLGLSLRHKGDLDGAIAEYRTAIRLNPNHADAHVSLGAALRLRGDLEGAIAELRRAIALNPNHTNAHNNLAVALSFKGDPDGAITELRTVILLDPNHSGAHYVLGRLLMDEGETLKAAKELKESIRLAQSQPYSREQVEDARDRLKKLGVSLNG